MNGLMCGKGGRPDGFLAAVDRLIGIEHQSDDDALAEFARSPEAPPLSEGQVVALLGRVLAERAAAERAGWVAQHRGPLAESHATGQGAGPSAAAPAKGSIAARGWRRVGFPLAFFVLAAATVPLVIKWSGRNSSEQLSYAEAIGELLDASAPTQRRVAAQGRVLTSLKGAIRKLQEIASKSGPPLDHEIAGVFVSLAAEVADPAARRIVPLPHWGFERDLDVMLQLGSPRAVEALQDIAESARFGIRALERVGSEAAMARNSALALRSLKQLLPDPGAARPVR